MHRDAFFSSEVSVLLRHMDVHPIRAGFQSPWQNGVAERWGRSCRRELRGHVIVLDEPHLLRLLREFLHYYHSDRTHLSLGKDPPTTRAVCARPVSAACTTATSGGTPLEADGILARDSRRPQPVKFRLPANSSFGLAPVARQHVGVLLEGPFPECRDVLARKHAR
jgi:hypothetical protein